jgi:tRNA-uridine 2-sulfurtransferase
MDVRGKNIHVGLSGGVDSAVSAALLRQAGATVTGIFIKGWYPPGMPCTWAEDRRDAMRVAARLRVPFYTLDASEDYKKNVIDYLLSEYRAGRTPNPDVMCNRDIKFGAFYRFALKAGADGIATGHYRSGEKDQSYFLWAVPKEVLESTLFPVGAMDKSAVRSIATRLALPVAQKKDSQGICFLGSISVDDYLRSHYGESPGNAYDTFGREVGAHMGAILYTIGERIPLAHARHEGPWYVIAKDIVANTITVSRSRAPDREHASNHIQFSGANWIRNPGDMTHAQYRYRGPRVPGTVDGSVFRAERELPELPAPGQSIVFYAGNALVGGGIIV